MIIESSSFNFVNHTNMKVKTTSAIIYLIISFMLLSCNQQVDKQKISAKRPAVDLFLFAQNGKSGYIDGAGNIVIKPQFDSTDYFHEGLAAAKINGKWGYINETGEWIITPQFESAGEFSEGLARVWTNDKSGYIDKKGNYLINPQFSIAGSFSEGLAGVCIGNVFTENGKCGYYR